jgi:DNA-binding LytR/AlgR family response regulator
VIFAGIAPGVARKIPRFQQLKAKYLKQAQELRLAPFGIVRVHRSRLVNLKRVVALEWRAAGDFEVRLDSGETYAGSRRFKAAVAAIAT